MLYNLLYPLRDLWFGFNVFQYISFRAVMASITSFLICVIAGPFIIRRLSGMNIGERQRKEHVEKLYELHKHKEGTPTMGGIIIILSILVSAFLWTRLDNKFVILCLISVLWLGIVGFVDDYLKLSKINAKGLSMAAKFSGQLILAVGVAVYLYHDPQITTDLYVPFFKNALPNLGIIYLFFVVLVITGSSNAVNLTDGLDGLAVGSVCFIALSYSIISYLTGHVDFSQYLNLYYLSGSGELTIICAILAGSALGFLWFNSYPATVFMGDTGALALGGLIGVISVIIKKELLLIIVGGVFVVEALSVIIQIASFKLFGKRIFLMTPFHHHLQLKGWEESKITVRFWIVGVILALFGLATLKLM